MPTPYEPRIRPRRRKRSICETTGKLKFKTQARALNALENGAGDAGSIRVYWCREFCQGWHTTSKEICI